MRPIAWLALVVGGVALAALLTRLARRKVQLAARGTVHQFRARLRRYKLQERRLAKAALGVDPTIVGAVRAHATQHGLAAASRDDV